MKPLTSEWIRKAEGDFATATREAAVSVEPNHDAVAFHAQQCVEKYLKALLIEAGRTFPRIHDLCALLDLAGDLESNLEPFRDRMAELTDLGIEVRYPGAGADSADAAAALALAGEVRAISKANLESGGKP